MSTQKILLISLALLFSAAVLLVPSNLVTADTSDSTTYGSGNFGDCNYGSCTITLTGDNQVNVNVIPTPEGRCTVQSNTPSVLTDSSTGYTLTMTTSTTENAMISSGGEITPVNGTAGSPATLSVNTWGYRVDGLDAFGAGPTSPLQSGSTPAVTFAAVPSSEDVATPVASSMGPANPAIDTTVWYGVCADASIPAGTYSTTVTYTAVTN